MQFCLKITFLHRISPEISQKLLFSSSLPPLPPPVARGSPGGGGAPSPASPAAALPALHRAALAAPLHHPLHPLDPNPNLLHLRDRPSDQHVTRPVSLSHTHVTQSWDVMVASDAGRHMCVCTCGRCVRGDGRRRTELRTGLDWGVRALYVNFRPLCVRRRTLYCMARSLSHPRTNPLLVLLTYFSFSCSKSAYISITLWPVPFYQTSQTSPLPDN